MDSPWRLEFTVSLHLIPDDPSDFGVAIGVLSGMQVFQMTLGTTESGDPIIELPLEVVQANQPTVQRFELFGAGPGYHSYFMNYTPSSSMVALGMDGSVLASDYSGRGVFDVEHVSFGSSGHGSADWSSIVLSVTVPEPPRMPWHFTLALFCSIGLRAIYRLQSPLT